MQEKKGCNVDKSKIDKKSHVSAINQSLILIFYFLFSIYLVVVEGEVREGARDGHEKQQILSFSF